MYRQEGNKANVDKKYTRLFIISKKFQYTGNMCVCVEIFCLFCFLVLFFFLFVYIEGLILRGKKKRFVKRRLSFVFLERLIDMARSQRSFVCSDISDRSKITMSDIDVGILKQEILSLLVSAKYGLTEHELLNDYRLFNSNRDLPYRDLGYPSLISLLRSWPDVCRFQQQGNNSAMKILAVEEESTKHILSMVKGQRQSKSRRSGRGGRGGRKRGGDRGSNGAFDNRGARFTQGFFTSNNNRSGGNNRGGSNSRAGYNNNRSERPMPPSRSAMGQSNQSFRGRSNVRLIICDEDKHMMNNI